MKKPETLTKGEELLTQVLEECLDEDLSFVPPEREIARTHRFSEAFEKAMEELAGRKVKEREIRRHFVPRYGYLAACVLVVCVCSALFLGVLYPDWSRKDSGTGSTFPEDVVLEEAAEDAAAAKAEETQNTVTDASEGTAEETELSALEDEAGAAPGDAGAKYGDEQSGASGSGEMAEAESGMLEAKEYCGQTVYPADQQEVPETLDGVTAKVNCPVQDEENPVLYLTIGNTGEETVEYVDGCSLEVWLDGGWYVIASAEEKVSRIQELEAGMAVDEIVDLSGYEIDYGAQRYRLVTWIGTEKIGVEFTFAEVFSEIMED